MLNQVEGSALLKFRCVFFQAVIFAKTNLTNKYEKLGFMIFANTYSSFAFFANI